MNILAEILEASRSAADEIDRADGVIEAERLSGVEAVRSRMAGAGRADCEECGCGIPEARRAAVPWAVRCAPCQEVVDARGRVLRG